MTLKTLTAALALGLISVSAQAADEQCTPSTTSVVKGEWKSVRHLIDNNKRAECFESKCDVTYQEFKEAGCGKKKIKSECEKRNLRVVKENAAC